MNLFVLSAKYSGDPITTRFRVLVDGEIYWVNRLRLAQLKEGKTPAELSLDPEQPGEEEDE